MPSAERVSPDLAELGLGVLESADEPLLAAFLRTVAHDLRSPLMTLSLSAELLADTSGGEERTRVAIEALTHGVRDMERMLDAVTTISRARTRILSDAPVMLAELVRGQVVISSDVLDAAVAAIDPRYISETLAALSPDPSEVRVELRNGQAQLSVALTEELAKAGQSPLHALFGSLQRWAGTPLVALAAAEVQAVRQHASIHCVDGRVLLTLPLLGPRS